MQLDPIPEALVKPISRVASTLDERGSPIIINLPLAVVLGKAIFWDMQIGSGGITCATCHHHAGADSRLNGQLAWRTLESTHDLVSRLEPVTSGLFPFVREPFNKLVNQTSKVVVMGSAGIIRSMCSRQNVASANLGDARFVTPRNAPSVINARLYQRIFWDGRANPTFNGLNSWGFIHPSLVSLHSSSTEITRVADISNASLASQALSPFMTSGEMICDGVSLADIARRILPLRILSFQNVHRQDSVLGPYRARNGQGLSMTYDQLFKKVFARRFWQPSISDHVRPFNRASGESNLESNFGLMLGLSLMAYEETLVSNQAPFDRPRGKDGYPLGYTPQQRRGIDLFNRLECDFCHSGPALTSAADPDPVESPRKSWVDRRIIAPDPFHHSAQVALLDVGFANIGVTPSAEDPGVGGVDPLGQPLSYAEQFLRVLKKTSWGRLDRIIVDPRDFSIGFEVDFKPMELRPSPDGSKTNLKRPVPLPEIVLNEANLEYPNRLGAAVKGAFKIPSLRNVELTGPYMHNGSMKSLEEIIDFYDRGGNFPNPEKIQTFVHPQHLSVEEKRDIKEFLLTLTDERVRWERAPFDHPALRVPAPKMRSQPQKSEEEWIEFPAIGRFGRSITQGPLRSFEERLRSDSLAFTPEQL